MLDTLKAIGVPATVAAVVSTLVVTVPLLFKIDERYAKEEDLRSEIQALTRTNDELQRELAQLSGFQQAMTRFILEGRLPGQVVGGAPRPILMAPPPQATEPELQVIPVSPGAVPLRPMEKPNNWRELNEALGRQQKRLVEDE